MSGLEALVDDALHQVVWDTADELPCGALTASPADAKGRGIDLLVRRGGRACDLAGANVYLVWRHRQSRKRGCEAFSAVDAASGRFAVHYPAAMTCEEGVADAQIMVSWEDRAVSSLAFCVRVEQVLVGGTASPDGFTLFLEAIKKYEQGLGGGSGTGGDSSAAADARAAAAYAREVAAGLLASKAAGEFNGEDGAPGRDGLDGKDGVSAAGEKGDKGDTGPAGPEGPQGPKGPEGPQGPAGPAGPAGESGAISHSWNGTVLTVTSASGTSSADLRGQRGPKGNNGKDGYQTPSIFYHGGSLTELLSWKSSRFQVSEDQTFVNYNDFVLDGNGSLARVTGLEPGDPTPYATVTPVALLGLPSVFCCSGLDAGAVGDSKSYAVGDPAARAGDLVYSGDAGALFRITADADAGGLCKLECISLAATRDYVDGKLAALAALDEVMF